MTALTCIRCSQPLDKHGEHLLPCAKSTNPEFRARTWRKRGKQNTHEYLVSLHAKRAKREDMTERFLEFRDRFEAIREAA